MSYPPQGNYPPPGGGYPPAQGGNQPPNSYPPNNYPPNNYPPNNYPPPGPPPGNYPPNNYPPPGPSGGQLGGYPPQGGYAPPPGSYPPQGNYPPQDASPYGGPYAPPQGTPPPYAPPTGLPPYNAVQPGGGYEPYNPYGGGYSTPRYASFWWRVLASIVDSIVVSIPSAIVGAILGVGGYSVATTTTLGDKFGIRLIVAVIGALIAVAYQVLMLTRNNGKTVGDMVCSIQVVSASGGSVSQDQALRRAGFQAVLSLLAIIPFLGFVAFVAALLDDLSMLWDANKQTYHDKFANTSVIKL